MDFEDKLNAIKLRHDELGDKLNNTTNTSEIVELSKEYSELKEIVDKIDNYFKLQTDIEDYTLMLNEEDDANEKEIIYDEINQSKQNLEVAYNELQLSLIPKDEDDERNAILEIRAGTGGDEASLFAADLFNMYHKYALKNGWKFEILSISEIGVGGYKEASANIVGKGVFLRMKFESGVHRVQRVPATETQGRVHTSAATVAVLPEVEDIDVKISDKDLRVDIFRASGPGGQSVNTTDSAVRITHLPTGITVSQQDEKSQHKNREKAMKVLMSRIYDYEKNIQDQERSQNRKEQIGSGDRSERIRTYNFPQGRVTDHRINLTLYKINAIVQEGNLDEVVDALITEDRANKLSQINQEE